MQSQKLVVITGASRGLGLTLASEFGAHGWQVVGVGRSERPAGLSQTVMYRQLDASDAAACQTLWTQLHDEYPDAQVCLVNNAGGYVGGGLTQASPEDYMHMMQSCYFSAVYMTRGLALAVPAAKIINVISANALVAHKNNSTYGAAKAAEAHFFHALQEEFAPEHYQITNLYPSSIASHGVDPLAIEAGELAALVRQQAELSGSYYLQDITIHPTHTI